MCKTYNIIGSLASIKSHLERNNIYDFKSLKEVIVFQSSYETSRKQLISYHENLIDEEKNLLTLELKSLEEEIEKKRLNTEQILKEEIESLKQQLNFSISKTSINIFQKICKKIKQWNYTRIIIKKEKEFDNSVKRIIRCLIDNYHEKNNRFEFISSNFGEAVNQSVHYSLSELERKKNIIDNLNSFIYGALGEQKVVNTLENLSDDFILINDFSVSFSPAIYNRKENEYIKSVQIDHVLVAPSGIFLIETKNWSEKSLINLSLRSPVQQIRRTSFVLFKLLNNEMSNYRLRLDRHHWGDKKISIKNLIVMTNAKPQEEFQHVKILTLNELLGYINYFKPIFSFNETQKIADFLLHLNGKK